MNTTNATSWASVVGNSDESPPTKMVQLFAKKVSDTHKKLTMDRENRENNIIIFNVPEGSKEEDVTFFNHMCTETLQLPAAPQVEITRLGEKRNNHQRPIKAFFQDTWEKRKFLSKLFKLKTEEK